MKLLYIHPDSPIDRVNLAWDTDFEVFQNADVLSSIYEGYNLSQSFSGTWEVEKKLGKLAENLEKLLE